jgi:hypothetical protein
MTHTDNARSATAQLQNISRALTRAFACIMVLYPIGILAALLLTGTESLRGGLGFAWLDVETLTLQRRLWLAALVIVASIPQLIAFDRLRALFALYAKGIVFTAENVACMRAAGLWLLWAAITALLSEPVLSVAASWGTPQRHLQIGLHGEQIVALLSGAAVYAIAYVMTLAREANEERSQFV